MSAWNDDGCAVSWCTAIPKPGRRVCRLHAERPVLHSGERHELYLERLRCEDATKRSAQRRLRRDRAPQPVRLFE
jgi:hypothetical protein